MEFAALTASCGMGTSVFLCSGWTEKWVRLVFGDFEANGGRGRPTAGWQAKACPTGKLKRAPPSMVAWRGGAAWAGWAIGVEGKRDKNLEFGNWFSREMQSHFRRAPGHRESRDQKPSAPTHAARSRSKNRGPFSRKSSSDGNCLSLALVIRVRSFFVIPLSKSWCTITPLNGMRRR